MSLEWQGLFALAQYIDLRQLEVPDENIIIKDYLQLKLLFRI